MIEQIEINREVVLDTFRCPHDGSQLLNTAHDELLVCAPENIMWHAPIFDSPDCVPTEELDQWDVDVPIRPARVFVRSIDLKDL